MTKARYSFADQAIAIVSGLSFALAAVTVCTIPFTDSISGARDFVVYWATGPLLSKIAANCLRRGVFEEAGPPVTLKWVP